MRMKSTAVLGALLITACGPKPLELPTDAVDRAATCGVIAAAEARTATNVQQALPFAAQEHIVHYALLAGSAGESFVPETANAVSRRMSELQEGITQGEWQGLKPACASAFPETARTEITLPAGRFDAQLTCYALVDFILTATEQQESEYGNELAPYRETRRKLNLAIAPGLTSRVGSDLEAQKTERNKALAAAAKLGSPTAVMRQCVERYG